MKRGRTLVVSPAVVDGHGGITTYARGVVDIVGIDAPVQLLAVRSNSPGGAVRLAVATLTETIRTRPALVHALTWRVAAPIAVLPRRIRPRLVVHCLGSELLRVGGVTRRIRDGVFRRADRLVAISAHTAAVVLEVTGKEAAVVPPRVAGVPAASRRAEVGPLRILSVARLVERKGHLELVRVVEDLRASGVDCELCIAGGDGPVRAELQEKAATCDWLTVAVSPSDAELARCYGEADVFALLTMNDGLEFEGFGIVLVEAAGAGLAVVAMDSGGVRDALRDGETGYVTATVAEAKDAIERLARDRQLVRTLARKGEAFAAEFTTAALAPRYAGSGLLAEPS